jgi:hypothetical protein
MWSSRVAGLLAATIVACGGSRAREAETQMSGKSIEDVLAMHNDSLMALPGVVGTAIGRCDGAPCIRVFVRDTAAARRARLADRLDGYLVRVEVTGDFHAR